MPVKTSLKRGKLHTEAKVRIAKFKDSKNGVETMDSRRKGENRNKMVQSRSSGNRGDKVRYEEGIKSNSGKRYVKSRAKDESREERGVGNEGFKGENAYRKRKRVYADEGFNNLEITEGKALRKAVKIKIYEGVGIEKQTTKRGSRKMEQWGVGTSSTRGEKSKEHEGVVTKNFRSKLKFIKKVGDAEMDGKLKRSAKDKFETKKPLEQNQRNNADRIMKSTKKKVQDKKVVDDDEARPKKKKRIRIDPYDTSNKRMDDGLTTKDGEEKEKDLPKDTNDELSKNAQFRAIRPSPSILSFVEDNLLGRRREIEIKRAGYDIELSAPLDNIPLSKSSERERIEEPVFRNKLEFFAAAKRSSSFPPPDLPEIAFAGRSNVGKSSLLNSLTRQWGVVRTSDKPGLTQTINFFKLGSKLSLVDLPGYGFAYAKEEVKEAWEELVKEYVSTRVGLKRVCLLVDTKWGMKPRDYELVELMERSKTKYQIVLTKTDLVFPIDVARRAMQIEESLREIKSAVQPAMMVSSKSGAGIRSLRTVLAKVARFVKP